MAIPSARTTHHGLLTEAIGDETLLYDEKCHKAYCLNPIASAIWKHCDGSASVQEIAAVVSVELGAPVATELVLLALADFRRDNLLQAADEPSPMPIFSRRDLTMKLGYTAAMMLPVVAAIAAPRAAQAYSGCVDCNAIGEPVSDTAFMPAEEGVSTPLVDREPDNYGYPEMRPKAASNLSTNLDQSFSKAASEAESFFSKH